MLFEHRQSLLLIFLAGISYIFLHELGHFAYAQAFGLEPSIVLTKIPSESIMGLTIGVSRLPAAPLQNSLVILGATIVPLIALLMLIAGGTIFESKELLLVAEVYLILIVFNLIPLPVNGLDANKLWLGILSLG